MIENSDIDLIYISNVFKLSCRYSGISSYSVLIIPEWYIITAIITNIKLFFATSVSKYD